MIIRKAKKSDLKQCDKILHVKELEARGGWYPSSKILKYRVNHDFFMVAEEDNKILGCIVGEKFEFGCMVWWFAVAKDSRRKGVGSALLREFERKTKKLHKHFVVLYTRTNAPKSIKFYRKKGYRQGYPYYEFIKDF